MEIALCDRARYGEAIMDGLTHTFDDCTGNWKLVGSGDGRIILCDRCDARFAATPENRLAAIDENYAGIYLRRLTAEGMTLPDRK